MKQIILTTDFSKIRPVFAQVSENIKRYNQLVQLFSDGKEYRIFAEPEIKNNKIEWLSEIEGKAVSITSMNPADSELAKKQLKAQVNKLYRVLVGKLRGKEKPNPKDFEEHFKMLDSFFEIPDYENIFQVSSNQGIYYVITQWGFVYSAHNSPRGLIKKLFPLRVTDMVFNVAFENGFPAKNEKLFVEYNQQRFEVTSDNSAKFILENIPFFTDVVVFQYDEDNKVINQNVLYCDNRSDYPVTLKVGKKDILITVIDDDGKILPNEQIILKSGGFQKTFTADSNGQIMLKGVENDTVIEIWQEFFNKKHNYSKIDCAIAGNNFSVKAGMPKNKMNFQVIYDNGQVVENKEIRFVYNRTEIVKTSDGNGNLFLDKVPQNVEVDVFEVLSEKKGKIHSFVNISSETTHKIVLISPVKPLPKSNVVCSFFDGKDEQKPISGLQPTFTFHNQKLTLATDRNGQIELGNVLQNSELHVDCEFKNKKNHFEFAIKNPNEHFKFHLTEKKRWWLWLLPLLLIPVILLLLRTSHNFEIQVVDSIDNYPIEAAEVKVAYQNGGDEVVVSEITDNKGIASITIKGAPLLFSLFSDNFSDLQLNISVSHNCYNIAEETFVLQSIENKTTTIATSFKTETYQYTVRSEDGRLLVRSNVVVYTITLFGDTLKRDAITDANGVCIVTEVPICEKHFTVFNSPGFKSDTLFDQNSGDVVLDIIPSPCDEISTAGTGTGGTKEHLLGQPSGTIYISYNTQSEPDEIIVYNCEKKNIVEGNASQIIFKTNGLVSTNGTVKDVPINFNNPSGIVTVVIKSGGSTSRWMYRLTCPE